MSKTRTTAQELAYRVPMPVTQILVFEFDGAYPVCPRCEISMEWEYQRFCDRCGQKLDWKGYKKAQVIYPQKRKDA